MIKKIATIIVLSALSILSSGEILAQDTTSSTPIAPVTTPTDTTTTSQPQQNAAAASSTDTAGSDSSASGGSSASSGGGGSDSTPADVQALVAAAKVTPPKGFLNLINTFRGIAVVLLLIAEVGAAVAASLGNNKIAIAVGLGALFLFGGFWVVTLVAESIEAPSNSDIAKLQGYGDLSSSTSGDAATYGPAGPIKIALNAGLNILTSVTLPFIIIFGLWLSLAVAAGESDHSALRGYILGASISLGASILAQIFKII